MTLEATLAAVDREIEALLADDSDEIAPFYSMMRYHLGLEAGMPRGKRLRPLVCVLLHEALGGDAREVLPAAAAVELLHNFTLIHDDIEDQDATRHHRPTLWALFGVPQAINAGDGMYALSRVAVQRLRDRRVPAERVLDAIAVLDHVCVLVCEGQYLDISFETRLDVSEERYRDMVGRKTGALLRASAMLPGIVSGADGATLDRLRTFGDHFGAAFQAYDDLKGVWGTESETGKTEMNDIAKRKMTLPLVLAIGRASPRDAADLARVYAKPAPLPEEDVRRVRALIDSLDVRAEVERFVAAERDRAFAALDELRLRGTSADAVRRLVSETSGAGPVP